MLLPFGDFLFRLFGEELFGPSAAFSKLYLGDPFGYKSVLTRKLTRKPKTYMKHAVDRIHTEIRCDHGIPRAWRLVQSNYSPRGGSLSKKGSRLRLKYAM